MKVLKYLFLFIVVGMIVVAFYVEMTMPFPDVKFFQDNDVIRVKSSGVPEIHRDDILLSCDSIRFFNNYTFEKYVEKSHINTVHNYKFLSVKTGKIYTVSLKYHKLAKNNIVFLLLLVSIIFLVMAYVILSIGPGELYDFFLFMFFITVSIMAAMYRVCFYNKLLYSMLIVFTSFIPGFYLSFLSVFPYKRRNFSNSVIVLSFLTSTLISLLWLKGYFTFLYFRMLSNYIGLMGKVKIFQLYVLLAVIFGFIIIAIMYRSASNTDKKRLKWFMIGQIIGFSPLLLLYSLSLILLGHELVNLAYVLLFVLFVPFSFLLGVLKYKLGSINFIMIRIIIVLFYVIVGVLFLLFGELVGKYINYALTKEIVFPVFLIIYSLLVYFSYKYVLNFMLRTMFREYFRKMRLVNRYIDLLIERNGSVNVLDEVFKHIMKLFDLSYMKIRDSSEIKKCFDEYNIKLSNGKTLCVKKNNDIKVTLDEMYMINFFISSLLKKQVIR